MAKHNSNSRTVAFLRDLGFTAQTVEMWIDRAGVRRDLFNLIDVLTMQLGEGILGIQATVSEDTYDHRRKALDNPALLAWLRAGGRFQLWRWNKVLKGTRAVWRPFVEEAYVEGNDVVFRDRDEWVNGLAA
jgi:hypothetical protein